MKAKYASLLREVLEKRAPALLAKIDQLVDGSISAAEREKICNAIVVEFTDSGLRKDWEPTRRGLELDDLIDEVRRSGLPK